MLNIDGVTYKEVEVSSKTCEGCDLFDTKYCLDNNDIFCTPRSRKDGKNVIFIKQQTATDIIKLEDGMIKVDGITYKAVEEPVFSEYTVGDVFEVDGKTVKVVKDRVCGDCCFNTGESCNKPEGVEECVASKRLDNTDVKFVVLKPIEVGDTIRFKDSLLTAEEGKTCYDCVLKDEYCQYVDCTTNSIVLKRWGSYEKTAKYLQETIQYNVNFLKSLERDYNEVL